MLTTLFLLACTGKPVDDTGTPLDTSDSGSTDAVCESPTDVPCVDAMILDLSLHDDKVSDGAVETTVDGTDFVTTVDASAGGASSASKKAWVYVKFNTDGATRVDIDDDSALESMDWDMSLRRFIVRLNGGDTGPSCVGVAAVGGGATYESITSVPEGTTYEMDDYYNDQCELQDDNSGLPGSPDVAMGGWWGYENCLTTTMQPYLIQLADGRVIKLVVEAYYPPADQDECNSTGTTTAEGGYYTLRWAQL